MKTISTAAAALIVLCTATRAQTTVRISLTSAGAQASGLSAWPAVSADGRFIAFASEAPDIVVGDTNAKRDVFVRDRQAGTVERISVDSSAVQANDDSIAPSISNDGRFVVFQSPANNLVGGDGNQVQDVFVRDRQLGTTIRVSMDAGGGDSNGLSWVPSMGGAVSGDGRFVMFESNASDLVGGDTNGARDTFVRDLQTGTTEVVSVSSLGVWGNSVSSGGWISNDGRFVGFMSWADNLVPGDTNQTSDIFVRDRLTGTTEIISIGPGGTQSNGQSNGCTLSADGRFVAFTTASSTFVAGDNNAAWDVYLRDRLLGTIERVSVSTAGVGANAYCWGAALSGDGRFVSFMGGANNLVAGDTNGWQDIFIRDRGIGTTQRVSLGPALTQGNGDSDYGALSLDGRSIVFTSAATNLVLGDTNVSNDVFGRDWLGTAGVDLCQPGVGGVIPCPCANPSGAVPGGCDNSAGSGGACLQSTGVPSLGLDTLAFTTNGEPATALSIVLQGTSEVTGGIGLGQGVRCVGGFLRRLYIKNAVGGSTTSPSAGEASVSSRSAALGDPLSAGARRWYAVYYRDPVVLGGCPSTSTYNVTQTQLVSWGP